MKLVVDLAADTSEVVALTPQEVIDQAAAAAAELVRVPAEVTKYQFKVAVEESGFGDTVRAAFAALPNTSRPKMYWADATTITRDSGFITAFQAQFSISDAVMDQLFRDAHIVE